MGKKPGLPADGFKIEVDEEVLEAPAVIEDYLDRTLTPPPARQPAPDPVSPVRRNPPVEKPADLPRKEAVRTEPRPSTSARPRERRPVPRRLERKELSIDAETSRMIDRVVSDMCEQTPQKDAKASEFVRAIIQLAEEARHHQDFSHVNRRGQWGSPTARAFVADLKDAFLRAIGRHYIDRYPAEAREYLMDSLEGEDVR